MEQEKDFYLSRIASRNRDIISSAIDDDLILLSIDQGKYYGTGAVGLRVWELLQKPLIGNELVDILLTEFMVERPVCEEEVVAFLMQLHEKGLIEVS